MQKLTKEYKIYNDTFQIKIGMVDKTKPKVFYLFGRCWVTPMVNDIDNDVFNDIKNNFVQNFKNILSLHSLSKRYILSFSVSDKMLKQYEHNYLSIEMFIRQKDDVCLDLKTLKSNLENDIQNLFNHLYNDLNDCQFIITKKR